MPTIQNPQDEFDQINKQEDAKADHLEIQEIVVEEVKEEVKDEVKKSGDLEMGKIVKTPIVGHLKKIKGLDTDFGVYSGQLNQANEREGHGRQEWRDGSYYVGEWKGGLKHGRGEYS